MFKRATPEAIKRARALRRTATEAEKRLWWKLRELNARFGYHFRRQAPFRSYSLDFVEHNARLVIELDGSQHGEAAQRAHDKRRDGLLAAEGYRTLRYWNHQLTENMDGVIGHIVRVLEDRLNRPPPFLSGLPPDKTTSPQRGR